MSDDPLTVGDRIEAMRRAIPPPPERNSRRPYISWEDLAAQMGTTSQRLLAWRWGEAYPDDVNREKLAAASRGSYEQEDFIPAPGEPKPARTQRGKRTPSAHPEELEARVVDLEEGVVTLWAAVKDLQAKLASQQEPPSSRSRRGHS